MAGLLTPTWLLCAPRLLLLGMLSAAPLPLPVTRPDSSGSIPFPLSHVPSEGQVGLHPLW